MENPKSVGTSLTNAGIVTSMNGLKFRLMVSGISLIRYSAATQPSAPKSGQNRS